jgi:hypothetical protein
MIPTLVLVAALGLPAASATPAPQVFDVVGNRLASVFDGSPRFAAVAMAVSRHAPTAAQCGLSGQARSGPVPLFKCCPYMSETAQDFGCYDPDCHPKLCTADSCNCSC